MVKLKQAWGGHETGSVISVSDAEAKYLIDEGIATASTAKAHEASPPKAVPLTPLTIPESMWSLREHILRIKAIVASGNKGEIDKLGARLDEIVEWLDAVHDDKRTNPRSIETLRGELPLPVTEATSPVPQPSYPHDTKYEGTYQPKEKS